MMLLKLQDARIRRRQFEMKKDLTHLRQLTVDSSLVRHGTPRIHDAMLRNSQVMGLRIGSGTAISLYSMWRDPMVKSIQNQEIGSSAMGVPHSGMEARTAVADYDKSANNPQYTTQKQIVNGFENRNHFKDGETVPKYLRVQLELTNRVTNVDSLHRATYHSMFMNSLPEGGGTSMPPVCTPVPVGETLPAEYTIHYRVVVGKEPDLNASNLNQPPTTGFSQVYATFNQSDRLNSESSETFRYTPGVVATAGLPMPEDISGTRVPEQGFTIRMSDRLFSREGRLLCIRERPTAAQPNVPLDLGHGAPVNKTERYRGMYNAITCSPIALGKEEHQLRAPRWMLPPFDGDVFDPRTAKAASAVYDKNIAVFGAHYTPTGTTSGIHPGTRQKSAARNISVKLIDNSNTTPLRSLRQYRKRRDDLVKEGKLAGYIGTRLQSPALNANETAAHAYEARFGIDPTIGTRMQKHPPEVSSVPDTTPVYATLGNYGNARSCFTFHNGITGNYSMPSVAAHGTATADTITFPPDGPVLASDTNRESVAGTEIETYRVSESGFFLPANHRYVMFIIPYVVGPSGISQPLPPGANGGAYPYANVSIRVTSVTEDGQDPHQ